MTTINPGEPISVGNWRTAADRSDDPVEIQDRVTQLGLPGPSFQPQITDISEVSDTVAEITVDTPVVAGATQLEWWAGSDSGPGVWEDGTEADPNISLSEQVVFQVPRQQSDDSSFFCYRGANSSGVGTTSCNGFVVPEQGGVEPSPSDFPNEPDGFTQVNIQPWDVHPGESGSVWGAGSPSGNLAVPRTTSQEGLPTAPESPPNVARVRIVEGLDGQAPFNKAWYRFASSGQGVYTELYWATLYYFPSNFVNHPVQHKQHWPRFHNHNNSPFTGFRDTDMTVSWQSQDGFVGFRAFNANVGPSDFRHAINYRGQWFLREDYIRLNTQADANATATDDQIADGIVRSWITADVGSGPETHMVVDYTNARFFLFPDGVRSTGDGPSEGTFEVIEWHPIYGGTGAPSPFEQFYYVDHNYTSGNTF